MVYSAAMTAARDRNEVLRQRAWSEDALRAAGFRFWLPRKRLVMARRLSAAATVMSSVGPLQAASGDWLCHRPDEHEHWLVRQDLFERSYRPWDETLPRLAEIDDLRQAGCTPWYKYRGVWAQQLQAERCIQSLESAEPLRVEVGNWLLVGLAGEPWHMDDTAFRSRYHRPRDSSGQS